MDNSSVLRVAGTCGLNYPTPVESGTDWHGPFIWTLQEMKNSLPLFEIVIKSFKASYTSIMADVAENKTADIIPERFVMTPARYKENHIAHGSLGIYSSLVTGASRNDIVSNAFDLYSSVAILLAWVAIVCILRSSVFEDGPQAITRTFGSAFNQGLLNNVRGLSGARQSFLSVFLLYNYLVAVFYQSRLISMLTAQPAARQIELLEDLLLPQFSHIKVLVSKNGFAQHILSSLSHVYPALEDRLEMFEHYHVETDEDLRTWEALFANVNRGSHLFIDVGDNLMTAACRAMKTCALGGKVCDIDITRLKEARDPVVTLKAAWALRKNQPKILATITEQVLLQHAFGLLSSDFLMTELKAKVPIHTPIVLDKQSCFGASRVKNDCPTLFKLAADGHFKKNNRDSSSGEAPPVLDLGKYATIFMAYGAGIALATAAFIGERITNFYWKRRQTTQSVGARMQRQRGAQD